MRYLSAIICCLLFSCNQRDFEPTQVQDENGQLLAADKVSETLNATSIYQKHGIKNRFFVIADFKRGSARYYNRALANEACPPMSTFKIPNTLIGLESKAVKDEKQVIKWGKKVWPISEWNRDHDLQSAYKYSVL